MSGYSPAALAGADPELLVADTVVRPDRDLADLPLGAVDASVIAIAERLNEAHVATLDRRHVTRGRPCPRHPRVHAPPLIWGRPGALTLYRCRWRHRALSSQLSRPGAAATSAAHQANLNTTG